MGSNFFPRKEEEEALPSYCCTRDQFLFTRPDKTFSPYSVNAHPPCPRQPVRPPETKSLSLSPRTHTNTPSRPSVPSLTSLVCDRSRQPQPAPRPDCGSKGCAIMPGVNCLPSFLAPAVRSSPTLFHPAPAPRDTQLPRPYLTTHDARRGWLTDLTIPAWCCSIQWSQTSVCTSPSSRAPSCRPLSPCSTSGLVPGGETVVTFTVRGWGGLGNLFSVNVLVFVRAAQQGVEQGRELCVCCSFGDFNGNKMGVTV